MGVTERTTEHRRWGVFQHNRPVAEIPFESLFSKVLRERNRLAEFHDFSFILLFPHNQIIESIPYAPLYSFNLVTQLFFLKYFIGRKRHESN